MTGDRFCGDGGSVIGGGSRVPTDPAEYQHPAVYAGIGCNRLRCRQCESWVRQQPLVVCEGDARNHLAELYAAEDWGTLPYMKRTTPGRTSDRLYVCRCTAWLETVGHSMEDPDFDPLTDPVLPWRCAGHPAPALPVELNGLQIGSCTDLRDVVRRIADGWAPIDLQNGEREGPAVWLVWLYAYLLGLPEADRLSEAAAELLQETDPRLRGVVLFLFESVPGAAGIERVIQFAEEAAPDEVVRGYPVPEATAPHCRRVLDVLIARVIQRFEPDPLHERARDVVRRLLTQRTSEKIEMRWEQIRDLARRDGEWLARNAADVVRVHQYFWKSLLRGLLFTPGEALVTVGGVSLIRARVIDLAELRKWLKEPQNKAQAWVKVLAAAIARAEAHGAGDRGADRKKTKKGVLRTVSPDFPDFPEPRAIDARRSWTARFDSYDQRNEDFYYAIELQEAGRRAALIMAKVASPLSDRSTPAFVDEIARDLARVAAGGKSNTAYRGPGELARFRRDELTD
ncbi:MAG: hypothetical protein HYV63_02635 [Candidatus Schekmanbacteria bacterium]|nr:hypothetical protein [Candidatus Schekmanbacteria bacterium]